MPVPATDLPRPARTRRRTARIGLRPVALAYWRPFFPAPPVIDAAAFQSFAAAGHTRIPVVREVLSDLDTPLSVYLKLADGPHTYLF